MTMAKSSFLDPDRLVLGTRKMPSSYTDQEIPWGISHADRRNFPFRILFPRFRRGFRVAPSRSACLASPSYYRNRPRGSLGSFFSTPVCPMINLERVYERTPSKGHCPMLRQVIAPCASLSVSPGLGRLVIHSGGRCSTSPGRSTPRDSAGGWASAGGQVGDGPPLCAPSRWQIWSSS